MVHQHLAAAGQHIYKRFADEPEKYKLPSWTPAVALADLIVFLPLLALVGYTLGAIFPTLAIVEDPNPPAYEPVALDEGAADQAPVAPGKPITSSLRATRRLLSSVAGWRSYFRGVVLAIVIAICNFCLGGILNKAIPFIPLGPFLAQLALTQLRTAWTHIVITAPSELRFYQRLPPFKKTFEATCFPIFVLWVAEAITLGVFAILTKVLGLQLPSQGEEPPKYGSNDAWKVLVIFLVLVVLQLVAIVPANVLLVRVRRRCSAPTSRSSSPLTARLAASSSPPSSAARASSRSAMR